MPSITVEARRNFHQLACAQEVDVLEFMLALAESLDTESDSTTSRAAIHRIAELVMPVVDRGEDESARIERFVLAMRELGFRGNFESYYDVRNTLISDVIRRRTGIPISLCIVYMEVAERCNIKLRPVRFPMHFLLTSAAVPELFVDPFFGTTRDHMSCRELLSQMSGNQVELRAEHFAIASPRQVVVRVLRNLKTLFRASGAFDRALDCSDLILMFDPEQPSEYRDRGTMSLSVGAWHRAIDDLSTYLAMKPDAADRPQILRQLQWVINQQTSIH